MISQERPSVVQSKHILFARTEACFMRYSRCRFKKRNEQESGLRRRRGGGEMLILCRSLLY